MKKFIIPVIGLVIAFGIGSIFVLKSACAALAAKALAPECQKFVDEAILAVTYQWNQNELLARIDSQLLQPGDEEDLAKICRFYQRLGRLTDYYGSQGEVYKEDGIFHFEYWAEADFENGPGTITIKGLCQGRNKYIDDFNIKSEAFIE